ncbi:MAG TPA: hypothetical protein VKP67_07055 [Xanthobacteraceae bacterium]|nr:hypothetical protein [Xanthobacteraceae bacterium]
MTLILRAQRAQERIEHREQLIEWDQHDCAVAVGRPLRPAHLPEQLPVGEKWLRFLQTLRAPLSNSGTADSLDEAKAAIKAAYERARVR